MKAEKRKRKFLRPRRIVLLMFLAAGLLLGGWGLWSYHGPAPEREIFQGITYGCERLPETEQSGGLMHWARADLNVPGVELWVTPLDATAQERGLEYRLQHTSAVVREYGLAIAVNATLFSSDSGWIRMPGDIAMSAETVVCDHVVNHVDPNTYLLWWDDQNIAHLELTKPPSAAVLAKAKWAIGAEGPLLHPGFAWNETTTNWRTAIGADPQRKLVWVVCFDKASLTFVSRALARLGATIGVGVDGGSSMAMVIGSGAKNVRPGTVTGNWRPVATQFGFKARALR
jgi:hypothetical protein